MYRVATLLAALSASSALAQPKAPALPGEAMIREYFQRQAPEIAEADLRDYTTRDAWEKARPELRRQLLEMLGLWPMPPRTDLKATVTGKVERPKFTVEKLHFQSLPGLYVTGNLYVPKPAPKAAPTILYVCGHGNVVKNGVSYGSKVHYQHHPAWYAEHGYVALVIDTLQLSEIPGLHHGTYREKMWWWHTLGYTPAGVECWNAMRALDYLETRPEVDPKRIGVTGRSGGGAYSWWIAATDERIACAVPVAGIADLQAHLNEGYPGSLEKGVIAGHCDCMFMVNTYRWDFSKVIAMVAPRPVLLGNSDKDDIFPVPGYRRLADKVRPIYGLHGASDRFDLLETRGKHEDTLELRLGEYAWMNRWLKGDRGPVTEDKFERFTPEELKVLDRTPEGEINTTVQELFIRPASIELPKSAEVVRSWWPGRRKELMAGLERQVFRNWPRPVDAKPVAVPSKAVDGIELRAWDFTNETGVSLRLWLMTAGKAPPKQIILNVLDEADWAEWCADLGPEFATLLGTKPEARSDAKFRQNRATMESQGLAFAAVCPRGIGPTRWAEAGSKDDIQIRRRFALIGQTLDGQRVWDVRRAAQTIQSLPGFENIPLWLQGRKEMATAALYASVFEPRVAGVELWNPPASHREGPAFLNVRRILDVPQAVALMGERPVRLFVAEGQAREWSWVRELHAALGQTTVRISEGD